MECPICYQPISVEDEAYVASCYHRFCHSCIIEWTVQQRRHPVPDRSGARPDYRCPMCKQPYEYVLYECVLNSYRIEFVDEEARRRGRSIVGGGTGMALSAGHRRRRALYVKQSQQLQQRQRQQPQPGEQLEEVQGAADVENRTASGPSPSTGSGAAGGIMQKGPVEARARGHTVACGAAAARIRPSDDPELRAFVERELQAVLLQEDVEIVLQHVLGMLRNVLCGGGAGGAGSGLEYGAGGRLKAKVLGPLSSRRASYTGAKRARTTTPALPAQEDFECVISQEMTSFLQQDSRVFASQLYLFLASGLSVTAYDEFVFGPEVAPKGKDDSGKSQESTRLDSGRQLVREFVDFIDDYSDHDAEYDEDSVDG